MNAVRLWISQASNIRILHCRIVGAMSSLLICEWTSTFARARAKRFEDRARRRDTQLWRCCSFAPQQE